MQNSHRVLKKAIDRAGAKKVAGELNVSPSLIYKWCQDQQGPDEARAGSGAKNPLDRIKTIYETTEDPAVIQWICQMADGYFVKNPPKNSTKYHTRVLSNIRSFIKEFSETLNAISESYADDKKISKKEAALIRKEWEELKNIGEGFVRACELGKFEEKTRTAKKQSQS